MLQHNMLPMLKYLGIKAWELSDKNPNLSKALKVFFICLEKNDLKIIHDASLEHGFIHTCIIWAIYKLLFFLSFYHKY